MDMDNGQHAHHDHNSGVHFGWQITFPLVVHLFLLVVALGIVIPYGYVCRQANQVKRQSAAMLVGSVMAGLSILFGHITGISHYNPWFADLAVVYSGGACVLSLAVLAATHGALARLRNTLNVILTAVLTIQPLVSWVLVGLSFISLMKFCGSAGGHTGQCLAHGIMGTAFIVYGVILLCMLYIGQNFLERTNKSQEFYDSTVITLWGIVNTFTEHRWGQEWNHGDIQHTSMGIVWWAAGMLGVYMSWNRVSDKPKRNHIPAVIMLVTGYSMATHVQNTQVSTNIHFMFGVFLMLAGVVRIIEVSFVLHDQPTKGLNPTAFQYLTPMFLVQSGMMFMSATEEAMKFLDDQSIMAAPYVLFVTAIASLVFLIAIFLVQSYIVLAYTGKIPQENADIELRPFMDEAREFDVDESD